MPNYVLAYHGGSTPTDPAEQQRVMAAWMSWFGELGESIVDGGAPFGPSSSVATDRTLSSPGRAQLTGYSIIAADTLDDASNKAKGCPVLDAGGTVDVYETAPIG